MLNSKILEIREFLPRVLGTPWVSGLQLRRLWRLAKGDEVTLNYVEDHLSKKIPGFRFVRKNPRKFVIEYEKDEDLLLRLLQNFTYHYNHRLSWTDKLFALFTLCVVIELKHGPNDYDIKMAMERILPGVQSWSAQFRSLKVCRLRDVFVAGMSALFKAMHHRRFVLSFGDSREEAVGVNFLGNGVSCYDFRHFDTAEDVQIRIYSRIIAKPFLAMQDMVLIGKSSYEEVNLELLSKGI